MEKYCIYLRKSRMDMEAEARGEGDTLSRHRSALLKLASDRKLTISHIYEEIVSGETIAARPEMQCLLTTVEQGTWAGVLVMEVERLARGDTIDQGIVAQAFKYSNTKILTPVKIYDPNNEYDEEYFEFGLFMSRREYKTINRRLQRGRVASVAEGKWVGNKEPYGYTRVRLEHDKGYTLTPNPEKSRVVTWIFDWYATPHPQPDGAVRRLGVSLICRRLNEMEIPSDTGQDWTNAVIRGILRNPVYAGWIRWNHRATVKSVEGGEIKRTRPISPADKVLLYPGLHPAIVSQEIFDRVQQLLVANQSRPGPKQLEMKNPFSGLIVCGACGRAMVRRPYQSGRQEMLLCPYTSCQTVASDLCEVSAAVLRGLEAWLKSFDLQYAETQRAIPQEDGEAQLCAGLSALENEQKQLLSQEKKAYELVEQGIYTTELFLQRSRSIADKRERAEVHCRKLRAALEQLGQQEQASGKITPRIRTALAAYSLAQSPQEKNDLLKSVLQKVIYTKTQRNRWGGGDMTVLLFPKLP